MNDSEFIQQELSNLCVDIFRRTPLALTYSALNFVVNLWCVNSFQVKKKQFFRNFVAIMLFGVIGVFISFAIITAGRHVVPYVEQGLPFLYMVERRH